jgi:phosphotriesterase-related protein
MDGHVDTVLGPIPAEALGPTLVHEHLLVDTRPRDGQGGDHEPLALHNYYLSRRNDDNANCLVLDSVSEAVSELGELSRNGGRSLVEVTPLCLGRDPAGLLSIARQSGLNIIMGGGFYDHDYHAANVHGRSAEELTEVIVADCTTGVTVADGEGTAVVRPGVIGEIALSWPPFECEVTALVAAGRAQAATGRTLVIHPGRHEHGPRFALEKAESAGADPSRVVISHIDRTLEDPLAVAALAERGAFVACDLFGSESSYYPYSDFAMPNDAGRLRLIRAVAELGWIEQILVSHDIYSKTHLLRYGGEGYGHILRDVAPVMERFGLDEEAREQILVRNPARALTGREP